MQDRLKDKVFAYIKRYQLLRQGNRVILGLSGGADSVCLLLLMNEYREMLGISVCAVHVEHGIRGQEALEDAAFCRELCARLGIDFRLVHCDVMGLAEKEGISVEEAGRILRYRTFREIAGEWEADRIAVAHHRDDQAETLLLNLFRGTHLAGMQGMRPVQGKIIRPLLSVGRKEIEEWLQRRGEVWRTDSTNLEDDYARNRIRHHILPEAEKINCAAPAHLAEACSAAWEIWDYLDREAERVYKSCVPDYRTGDEIDRFKRIELCTELLLGQPALIRRMVLGRVMQACTGHARDVGTVHYEALDRLLMGHTGQKIDLPHGMQASVSYGSLIFDVRQREAIPAEGRMSSGDGYGIPVPGTISVDDGLVIHTETEDYEKDTRIPIKTYTKWMDYATIRGKLMLRTRRPGDYIVINNRGDRKKLKDYFIDEKIDRHRRSRIWLVANGSHVLWVIGYRMSAACRVTERTETILKIQADGGQFHE